MPRIVLRDASGRTVDSIAFTIDPEEPKEEKPEAESALSKPMQNPMSFIFNSEHFISAMALMS